MTDPLKGTRIFLTSFLDEDVAQMNAWREDGEYLRLLDAEPAYPGMPSAFTQLLGAAKSGFAFPFALRSIEDRRMVGYASLDGILWSQGSAWLTLAIGRKEDRGKGYGREAMDLLLDFAFDELNLRRVSLTVFSYNAPAIRLYEGLGFVREGSFREFLARDGALHDMHLYGMLRREWRSRARRSEDC
ncbi:MAG: GNAT family protein [Thermaerobacter sp.]|nr:GNAT family protein [Thermaerobacter sp.]